MHRTANVIRLPQRLSIDCGIRPPPSPLVVEPRCRENGAALRDSSPGSNGVDAVSESPGENPVVRSAPLQVARPPAIRFGYRRERASSAERNLPPLDPTIELDFALKSAAQGDCGGKFPSPGRPAQYGVRLDRRRYRPGAPTADCPARTAALMVSAWACAPPKNDKRSPFIAVRDSLSR